MVAPGIGDQDHSANAELHRGAGARRRRPKSPGRDGRPSANPPAHARRRRAPAPWVADEMVDLDLRDQRLNHRLQRILSDLAERPTASIPAACGGRNEMVAAYNFFDNEKALPQRILQPHYQKTQQRIAGQERVILVPDTTEVDLTRPQQQVVGAGPLDDSSRRGAHVHALETFSEDGTPLGAVWTDMWARDEPQPESPAGPPPPDRKQIPIEEKESYRWLESQRQARAVAAAAPATRCILVADSESDIYEVFAEPRGQTNPLDWIIRACQDRGLAVEDDATARQLWAGVAGQEVLLTREITVRAHQPKTACESRRRRTARTARKTMVEVRAATVTLRPPWRPGERKLPELTVNVVQVRESNPPAGEDRIEWVLVTTLPIDTIEDVSNVIRYYTVRWMVEVFFRVLKGGCRIQERRFEHVERTLTFVAVALIVAWRVLLVCRLGRSCPDLDCEAIFEPAEWKAVYVAVHRCPAPEQPPRLGEMMRLIAQLGGYVNTPGRKDPPGPQTIWLGMQRMSDLAWGWETFGPGSKTTQDGESVPESSGRARHRKTPGGRT